MENLEEFSIGEPEKIVIVGSQLDRTQKTKLVSFLHENRNVFTWSHEDMLGISPLVIVHKLNAYPHFKPVQQRRMGYSVGKSKTAAKEVKKLCKVGFIKEVQYTMWLSNVVLVKK